jgi:uncharacterized protein YfkK (UPF0435 family)
MNIETKYNYEKIWTKTQEVDLLKIIAEEVGDADPQGTLTYIKDVLKKKENISVGSCKFRKVEQ